LQQDSINQQWNQADRTQKTIEKTADEVTDHTRCIRCNAVLQMVDN